MMSELQISDEDDKKLQTRIQELNDWCANMNLYHHDVPILMFHEDKTAKGYYVIKIMSGNGNRTAD